MNKARILSRGLLIVGLVAVLCACGWAAQRPADQNQAGAAGQGQATSQPRAGQPGSTPRATAPQAQAPSSRMAPAGQAMTLTKTTDLIGKEVKNPQGESLGVIHDIVLSPDFQQVSYVALSSGGTFGIGRTLHAVPWQALQVTSQGQVTLAATRDQFKQTAGFPNDNWPSQGNPQWLKGAAASQGMAGSGQAATSSSRAATSSGQAAMNSGQAAAGRSQSSASQAAANQANAGTSQNQAAASESQTAPSAQSSAPGATGQGALANQAIMMRRVTHLIGMAVRNPQNQDLGDIEDFAISASDGRVIYDFIAFGGVAGIGEKIAAVPAGAVRLQPQMHVAMLNATTQTLESAVIKPSELASLGSPQEMQRLSKLFPSASAGSALGYVPPSQSPQMQLIADEKTWGADSQIGKGFNPSNVKTTKGTVQSVGTFRPEGAAPGATGGLRLRVKTTDGNLVTVFAGPSSYAEKNNFFVAPGDEITITGSESKMGNRSVIVASQLAKGSQTLQLRDKSGKPLWTTQSTIPGAPGAAPGASQKSGAANQGTSGQSANRTRP